MTDKGKRALIRARDEQWSQALWPMDVNESKDAVVGPESAEVWMLAAREYWLNYAYECALAEDRVRARHRPVGHSPICCECSTPAVGMVDGYTPWPCPTLLDMIGPRP